MLFNLQCLYVGWKKILYVIFCMHVLGYYGQLHKVKPSSVGNLLIESFISVRRLYLCSRAVCRSYGQNTEACQTDGSWQSVTVLDNITSTAIACFLGGVILSCYELIVTANAKVLKLFKMIIQVLLQELENILTS